MKVGTAVGTVRSDKAEKSAKPLVPEGGLEPPYLAATDFEFLGNRATSTEARCKVPRTNQERQPNMGKSRVCGILAALSVSAALATGAAATPLEPPERFDHPYPGDVQINLMDSRFVGRECREWSGGPAPSDAAGCAWVADDSARTCVVVIAARTKKAPIADIIRHEIAHCNGWPADHPM